MALGIGSVLACPATHTGDLATQVTLPRYRSCPAGQQPGAEFPITPAGQLQFVQAALREGSAGQAAGVAYWGTEYVNGSGAGMTALWDTNYDALPALTQGWQ